VLPLAVPGIGAAAMFAFILSWNGYLVALLFMTTKAMRTARWA
jgi:ABC-type glycerol-3-phosphate transport system permease component